MKNTPTPSVPNGLATRASGTTKSIVMIGATGAVGSRVARELVGRDQVSKLTTLGRRPLDGISKSTAAHPVSGDDSDRVTQHVVDLFDPRSYQSLVHGHDCAICTLGVGEPSKVDKEQFVKIDKLTVIDFAIACKAAGVKHFELLGSVGANAQSRSFYLRTKGELVATLVELGFERLSIFQPSMILTPTNRYGLSQALTLAVWPKLKPLLFGGLRKYRGIPVDLLASAIAQNLMQPGPGVETLHWDDFMSLTGG